MDEKLLVDHFNKRLQQNVVLARLTTSRVGGPARYFITVHSADQLAADVQFFWDADIPFLLLGMGANVLISDAGLDLVVVHNLARDITVEPSSSTPSISAESGALFASVARQAAAHSLSGLEWASTVPGTVGGALYGNAGAFGTSTQNVLKLANILHRNKGYQSLTSVQMGFAYRSSFLKNNPGETVILSASFSLEHGDSEKIKSLMQQYSNQRRGSQPQGASTGSTFKNPSGDFAGRLIEAAGLKGTRIGGVQVSPVHANFFINDGTATARNYYDLIQLVRNAVSQKFGVLLETEIELIGDWQTNHDG